MTAVVYEARRTASRVRRSAGSAISKRPHDALIKITPINICGPHLGMHEDRTGVEEGKILDRAKGHGGGQDRPAARRLRCPARQPFRRSIPAGPNGQTASLARMPLVQSRYASRRDRQSPPLACPRPSAGCQRGKGDSHNRGRGCERRHRARYGSVVRRAGPPALSLLPVARQAWTARYARWRRRAARPSPSAPMA